MPFLFCSCWCFPFSFFTAIHLNVSGARQRRRRRRRRHQRCGCVAAPPSTSASSLQLTKLGTGSRGHKNNCNGSNSSSGGGSGRNTGYRKTCLKCTARFLVGRVGVVVRGWSIAYRQMSCQRQAQWGQVDCERERVVQLGGEPGGSNWELERGGWRGMVSMPCFVDLTLEQDRMWVAAKARLDKASQLN